MKKIAALFLATFIVIGAWAQDATATETVTGPAIAFEETTFDFGDIHQGDKVEHIFSFENTGVEPLIITNVQTTCGCTAPEWPRDPITPGQKASIKVVFNSAGKMGKQNKVITILSNAATPNNQVVITTNVLPKKEAGK